MADEKDDNEQNFEEVPVEPGTEDLPPNEGDIAWSDDDEDLKAEPPGDDFDDPDAGAPVPEGGEELEEPVPAKGKRGKGFASSAEDSLTTRKRSKLPVIIGAVLAVVVLGGGVGWFMFGQSNNLQSVPAMQAGTAPTDQTAKQEPVEAVDAKTASALFDQPVTEAPAAPSEAELDSQQPVLDQALPELPAPDQVAQLPPDLPAAPPEMPALPVQQQAQAPADVPPAPLKPTDDLSVIEKSLQTETKGNVTREDMALLAAALNDLKGQVATVKEQINTAPAAPATAGEDDRMAKLEARIAELTKTVAVLSTNKPGIEVGEEAPPKPKPAAKKKTVAKKKKAAPKVEKVEEEPAYTEEDDGRSKYVLSRRSTGGTPATPSPGQSSTVLRAAMPGVAWVSSDRTSQSVEMVQVGQTHPQIGKIRSIRQINGVWMIEGSRGTIRGTR